MITDYEFGYRVGLVDGALSVEQAMEPTLQAMQDAAAAMIAEAEDLVAIVSEVKL